MELIGAGVGIVGSLVGGKKGSKEAYKGFDYLKNSPLGQQYVPAGGRANAAQANLLGVGGDPAQSQEAFNNYLGSTGYNFQLQQGQNAITSSQASKGLLGSGATGKALVKYGQGLASTSFNNYLSQLGGLSTQGLQAGGMIGSAGTSGGAKSSDSQQSGIGNAFGIASKAIGSLF